MHIKIASFCLKIAAFCLMVVGYYLSIVEYYPSLLERLSPDYVHGRAGVEKLQNSPSAYIHPGDDGFDVFSRLFLKRFSKMNGNMKIPVDVRIEWVQVLGSASIGEYKTVDIGFQISTTTTKIAGGNQFRYPLTDFSKEIDKMKQERLLSYRGRMFSAGVVLALASLIIDLASLVAACRNPSPKVVKVEDNANDTIHKEEDNASANK